jgi:serine/threonine protein kinase
MSAPQRPSPYAYSQTGGPCSANSRPVKTLASVFHVDRRYEVLQTVGHGAYGVVISARDTKTGQLVAIKKIEKAFEHETFTKRTLRELKIQRLMQHDNILGIQTIQLPPSREDLNEIYVVVDLMETDLNTVIRSKQVMEDEHCQFFMYQILRGIKYLHSANVLHRDLKPSNLLVNSSCDLKICDFGLARADLPFLKVRAASMTDYVATRWYRGPEALLTYRVYTKAIDMWSVGCILGELLLRCPLLPGTSAENQLELIFDFVGTPNDEEMKEIPNLHSREKVMRMVKRPPKDLDAMFADSNPMAVDLLRRMLVFDPKKRITVDEALEHPYLDQFRMPDDEPTTESVSYFDFAFEREVLDMQMLKDMIYDEILLYHFTSKKEEYERLKLAARTMTIPMELDQDPEEEGDDELS